MERPKGVLDQIPELLRAAAHMNRRNQVGIQRQILALEQARKQDLWELISSPTLLDKPVGPRKKRMIALGLFAGLFAGGGAAILADKRTLSTAKTNSRN